MRTSRHNQQKRKSDNRQREAQERHADMERAQ